MTTRNWVQDATSRDQLSWISWGAPLTSLAVDATFPFVSVVKIKAKALQNERLRIALDHAVFRHITDNFAPLLLPSSISQLLLIAVLMAVIRAMNSRE